LAVAGASTERPTDAGTIADHHARRKPLLPAGAILRERRWDVDTILLTNEEALRSAAFFGTLTLLAFWEAAAPCRRPTGPTAARWFGNLTLGVLTTLVLRWVFPILTVGMAVLAAERDWGLLNGLGTPVWLELVVSMIVLDLVFYVNHRLFHTVRVLWRVHEVHHADVDFDITTSLRFHPLEGVTVTTINILVVLALGLPAVGVLAYEVLVSSTSLFTHGNVSLPVTVDRRLRRFVVTPDMHRVHHSSLAIEGNKNFASILSLWDHLFGSYCAHPMGGHEAMTIGIPTIRDARSRAISWMLAHPFSRRAGAMLRTD
jgi:sterol desaturase/sphingolipid hydroxylase (fatty acid hydroxylase superfamily)